MQPEPATQPSPHRATVDRLIDAGMLIVEAAAALAQIPAPPETKAQLVAASSAAYERVSRSVRRAVLLVEHLDDRVLRVVQQRTAIRKRVLRAVEDRIHREQPRPEARDRLQAELLDRLDSPDFLDDVGTLPATDIIANLIRDLGVDRVPPGVQPPKRRTPADNALLCDRAANPPAARPRNRPVPDQSPTQPPPKPDPVASERSPHPGGSLLQSLLARHLE